MPKIIALEHCPSCGHDRFTAPLPADVERDNGLQGVIGSKAGNDFGGFEPQQLARVEWRVCSRCALIFCLKRPSLDDAERWYGALFKHVERRDYDVTPLPGLYLANQASFARELHALLESSGTLDGVRSVLHFRCNAGHLLDMIRNRRNVGEVYGLEYFQHPAQHAAGLLGADRVRLIGTPEPRNPFARASFDLVLVEHFLTHAHDPAGFLDYLKGLLAPGGKLVVFNEQDHARTMRDWGHYVRGINFFHKQLYTEASLAAFLRSRGLEAKPLPHPAGRPWAVANHSLLFVCRAGEAMPVPEGDAQGAVRLLQDWWRMHLRYQRTRWIASPLRKLRNRLLRPHQAGLASAVDSS